MRSNLTATLDRSPAAAGTHPDGDRDRWRRRHRPGRSASASPQKVTPSSLPISTRTAADRTVAACPASAGPNIAASPADLTDGEPTRNWRPSQLRWHPSAWWSTPSAFRPKRNGGKIRFFELSDDEWNTVMAVNVAAPFFLVREVYRHMPTDGSAQHRELAVHYRKDRDRRRPGRGVRPVPAQLRGLRGIEGGTAEPDGQPCPRTGRFPDSRERRGTGIRADTHDGRCSPGRQAPRPGPHEALRDAG